MKIPTLSHSLLAAYETCPRQCYEIRIAKNFVEPESQHIIWGNYVHKCLEERVGKSVPLPENTAHLEPLATYLCSLSGARYCELKLAIDDKGSSVEFFDKRAWFRGVADLLIVDGSRGSVYDYKTGKPVKDDNQLAAMALLTFAKYPQIEELVAAFLYLKYDDAVDTYFTRDQIPQLLESIRSRGSNILHSVETGTWYPKPSGLCKNHCAVVTCEYNGRRKNG